MAWLFGSIKKPKPEVYVSNEVEDGFNIVNTRPPPPVPLPRMTGGPMYPPAVPSTGSGPGYPLYPTIPGSAGYPPQHPYLAICPQAPPGYKPGNVPPSNPLDSIPFKLAPSLDSSSTSCRRTLSELERIRSSLNQVNKRINSPEFSYSFELERSVIHEGLPASN